MKTILWLDDYRSPQQWKACIKSLCPNTCKYAYEIIWVKTVKEFTNYIEKYGLPDAVCFDHDLGDINENELTGYDAAKYLVEYCLTHSKKLPEFGSQSANPVGRENILSILINFKKYV